MLFSTTAIRLRWPFNMAVGQAQQSELAVCWKCSLPAALGAFEIVFACLWALCTVLNSGVRPQHTTQSAVLSMQFVSGICL